MKFKFMIFWGLVLFSHRTFSQFLILPPTQSWSGNSESLIADPKNPWITPTEMSGFKQTPSYSETMDWLQKLCKASGFLKMSVIGKSPEGREIMMVVASLEKDKSAKGIAQSKKPTLLVQCGIHSGEIDGKDASMMLLRDLAFSSKKAILTKVNVLIVPILNVDGHERSGPCNRPNQRGPENMGWRTNAQNLNLNRDYMKLDTKEIQAMVEVFNQYDPDFFMDIHVTDGADFQYDVTYGFMGKFGHSPAIANWIERFYVPGIENGLKQMGHIQGLFLNQASGPDFSKGILDEPTSPNFSNGYADLRGLPGVLIENHSLKPFKQRVLGTYVLLEESMKVLANQKTTLFDSIQKVRKSREIEIPLMLKSPDLNQPAPDSIMHLGIVSTIEKSDITNGEVIRWQGKPESKKLPFFRPKAVGKSVVRPEGFWVPVHCEEIISRLKKHGIQMEVALEDKEVLVELSRIKNPKFSPRPYEGRFQVNGESIAELVKRKFRKGSVWVSTNQPLGNLAVVLLNPRSPESFLQWGFFNTIFQPTEYMEAYVIEPLAKNMLNNSPDLRARFEMKKQEEPAFANNPGAILDWFYKQSPYADSEYLLYPVGIVINP